MTLRTFADLVEQELSLTYLGRGGDLLLNWVRSGLLFLKTPLDVLSSLPQFAVGWKLRGGGGRKNEEKDPTSLPPAYPASPAGPWGPRA